MEKGGGKGAGNAAERVKVSMLRSAWGRLKGSGEAAHGGRGAGGHENLVSVLVALWGSAVCMCGLSRLGPGSLREWPGPEMELVARAR